MIYQMSTACRNKQCKSKYWGQYGAKNTHGDNIQLFSLLGEMQSTEDESTRDSTVQPTQCDRYVGTYLRAE